MAEKHINIPQYFEHNRFDDVLSQIAFVEQEIKNDPQNIVFDLSSNEFVSVLGALLMMKISDSFRTKGCECFVHYPDDTEKKKKRKWYTEIMGIVKKDPGKNIEEYLKKFIVPIQRCYTGHESLDAINKKIIPLIHQEFKPSATVLKSLNWSLWEVIGNSIVHGYLIEEFEQRSLTPVYCCAYDYKDFIEVAILDAGQGILSSLSLSGKEEYKNISSEEALKLCVQDGVSGSKDGSPGFGLYGCAEIARKSGGELIIISGDKKILLKEGDVDIISCIKFQGTMVQLKIPSGVDIDLTKVFSKDSLVVSEDIDWLIGNFDD